MRRKKISAAAMQGDKGIACIHQIVNDMGFIWNPLHLEAGIDGIIEIRDPTTFEVSNCIIQVQSKAGPSYFRAETDASFEFLCDERDLDYWLRGNAPVVLIVSRPTQNEAYWISIKDYFRNPARRKSRKIIFDKSSNRFEAESRDALSRLALPADGGFYLSAIPTNETLTSNLLPLMNYPKRLFRASTTFRFPRQIWEALHKTDGHPPGEWCLHDSMLYAFHDLTFEPWSKVCKSKTTENLATHTFASSQDLGRRNIFSRLMQICLKQLLHRHSVRFSRDKEHFFFDATSDLREKKVGGLSVFKGFESKKVEGRISYYRHRAMKHRLMRFDEQWYLEITPTYHFTQDGYRLSRFYEERLKGIKQRERQNKVHFRQIRLWESVLQQTYNTVPNTEFHQGSLFEEADGLDEEAVVPYPHLEFGSLVEFNIDWGIPETAWLPSSENSTDVDALDGGLFEA